MFDISAPIVCTKITKSKESFWHAATYVRPNGPKPASLAPGVHQLSFSSHGHRVLTTKTY